MKIFVVILLIFSFLILSDSLCTPGGYNNVQPQFGPGCMYRCHCVDDVQCDYVTGKCSAGCAAAWMGPGCQYGDIAYNKLVYQLSSGSNTFIDGWNATDGLPTTCVGPTSWVVVDLNATYRISELVINLSNAVSLQGLEVTVGNASFDSPSHFDSTCFKQNITEIMAITSNVVCPTDIIGRYLVIRVPDNSTRMTLCDVRVYGGRSLAYRRNASQSSTYIGNASRAIDGGTSTRFNDGTCTHTDVEQNPWWTVDLARVYQIFRLEIFNREDCCGYRLSGFSVWFATNGSFNSVFKYPDLTPEKVTEVIQLSENTSKEIRIRTEKKTKDGEPALTLCEVFVFGDCPKYYCGWSCDYLCFCEGPIDKQNKINGICPGSCEAGWWGPSCNNTCNKNCKNNICNSSDGQCYECFVGKWGPSCEYDCSNCTTGTECNIYSGICVSGCRIGIFGIRCDQKCGYCAQNESCDRTDGNCSHGCLPGWQLETCSVVCSPGWFGVHCVHQCDHCANTTCDHINGTCPFGCIDGYKGETCSEACSFGWYGVNCSEKCGNCASATCVHINGTCQYGCTEGYTGTTCQKKCSDGWYGVNCREKCGHCANTTCDHVNGSCAYGCSEGYEGRTCLEGLHQDEQKPNSALQIGGAVGGALGAVLFLSVIALVIFLWRRRREQNTGLKHGLSERDTQLTGRDNSTNIYENVTSLTTDKRGHNEKGRYNPVSHDTMVEKVDVNPASHVSQTGDNNSKNAFAKKTLEVEIKDDSETEEYTEKDRNCYYNSGNWSVKTKTRIAVADLREYVKRTAYLSVDIEDDFKKLLVGPQHEMKIALKQENRQKNRYKGLYAYDKNRVILDPLPDKLHSDYINASFIKGYKKDKAFIAAQGPITATVNDFWRMIWQYDVNKIVMLTELIEEGKQKCVQYWPNEGTLEFGMIQVDLINDDICADYTIRSLGLSQTDSMKQKNVTQFHFTAWPDRGVPHTAYSLVQFWNKVRKTPSDSPIVVHCSAGIGRTGTYIALDYLFDEGTEEGYVDIFDSINELRQQRVGLVQTMEQYVYLHEVIAEAFMDTGTSMYVDDFQTYYAQMRDVDPRTKQSKLLSEFNQLQEEEHVYFEAYRSKITEDQSVNVRDEFYNAKLPENKNKNRYNNILPSEKYIPFLSTYIPGRTDYINAVCLPTRKKRTGLLLTQMPLPDTTIDFWRLVFDYEVHGMVMMNEASIPGEELALYWPQKGETYTFGPFVVKTTAEVEKNSHMERMLQISKNGVNIQLLKQFVCSVWPSHQTVPQNCEQFLYLLEAVDDWSRQTGDQPILVQCLNGAERSGLFCVLWCALEQLKAEREVAIRAIVRQMRVRRQQILPNFEQYKFCHDAILHYLQNSLTYVNI